MSKSRIMGAGNASSTVYNSNVNLNTGGGNKKQGLPFSLNDPIINHRSIKIGALGNKRNFVFTINQLGGIGHTAKITHGGLKPNAPYIYGEISTISPSIKPDLSKYAVLQIPYSLVQGMFKTRTVNGQVRLYTRVPPNLFSNIDISALNYKKVLLRNFILSHMKTAMNVSTFYNEKHVENDIVNKLAFFINLLRTKLNDQSAISAKLPYEDEIGKYALLSTPGSIAAKIYKSHPSVSSKLHNILSKTDVLEAIIYLTFDNEDISPLNIGLAMQLV